MNFDIWVFVRISYNVKIQNDESEVEKCRALMKKSEAHVLKIS